MKAEHRKELQTNTLADMLGRTVRKVRTHEAIPWWRVALVVVLIGGVGVFFWMRSNRTRANSELWVDVDASTFTALDKLRDDEYKETNQGKAARFQVAFEFLWNRGIKYMGTSSLTAEDGIRRGIAFYSSLATECKGDPIWEPEALYSIAVGTEASASYEDKRLEEALTLYQALANGDYAKTAFGELAAKRAAQLNDPVERAHIQKFYNEFAGRSGVMPEGFHPQMIPKGS